MGLHSFASFITDNFNTVGKHSLPYTPFSHEGTFRSAGFLSEFYIRDV